MNELQLNPIVNAARQRWEETGLAYAQLAALEKLQFEVNDLSGWYLAASLLFGLCQIAIALPGGLVWLGGWDVAPTAAGVEPAVDLIGDGASTPPALSPSPGPGDRSRQAAG